LKPGDVNNEGSINIVDLAVMAHNWGTSNTKEGFDFNSDGVIHILESVTLAKNWVKNAKQRGCFN